MATHVVVIPFPFGSHVHVLFNFTRIMSAAAPDATFTFMAPARVLATIAAPAAALGNVFLCPIRDGCPSPPSENVRELLEIFASVAPESIREGMVAAAAARKLPVTSVVTGMFLWMVPEITEEMGVPWVTLNAGMPATVLAQTHTDLLRQTYGIGENECLPSSAEERITVVPALSTMLVKDLPAGILCQVDNVFPRQIYPMIEAHHKAAAIVLTTFEGLDPTVEAELKLIYNQCLPIGPMDLLLPPASVVDDPEGCLPWLDKQRPASIVYISFGTLFSIQPPEIRMLAEALEASEIGYLWSLKEEMRQHFPEGFMERTKDRQGMVVSWTPQVQVLAHQAVGAFMTHCGWNSVLESISSGTAMVVRPIFADQHMSARFVTEVIRVGVGLEGGVVTKEGAETALKTVLVEKEGERMRERMGKLKAMAEEAVGLEGVTTKNFRKLMDIVCQRVSS